MKHNYATWIGAALATLLIGLLTANLFITAKRIDDLSTYDQRVEEKIASMRTFTRFLSIMQDFETGYHGYALTGNEAFLDPYHFALRRIDGELQEIWSVAMVDEVQTDRVSELGSLTRAKLEYGNELVSLVNQYGALAGAWTDDRGNELMNSLRRKVDLILSHERELLIEREWQAARHNLILKLTFLILTVLSILAAAGFYVAYLYDIRRRNNFAEQLAKERDRAERMSRLKSFFLANLSHEVRTPLTGIIGYSEVLKNELTEAEQEFAEAISANGKRLLNTLTLLIEFSVLETDGLSLHTSAFRPSGMFEPILAGMPFEYDTSTVELQLDVADEDCSIIFDQSHFARILQQVIGNAVKFTESGYVRVSTRTEGQRLLIAVEDTGPGIPENMQEVIFDPFVQVSTGDNRSHTGIGIGLSLARGLAHRNNSTITLESQEGVGSTFLISVPLAVDQRKFHSDDQSDETADRVLHEAA